MCFCVVVLIVKSNYIAVRCDDYSHHLGKNIYSLFAVCMLGCSMLHVRLFYVTC